MQDYSPVWPHGEIEKVFDDIYMVRGTNITSYNGMTIQHSRNMTILDNHGDITLINTVRLDEKGLKALEKLGRIKHILSIGAFHGRDDRFYQDRYNTHLWTVVTQDYDKNPHTFDLDNTTKLPIEKLHFYPFNQSSPKEGFLFLDKEEGIIITCDSIKNWTTIDGYFNEETAKMALANGEIAKARISEEWLNATGIKPSDFDTLLKLHFKHLLSAHGDVLKDTAYDAISNATQQLPSQTL